MRASPRRRFAKERFSGSIGLRAEIGGARRLVFKDVRCRSRAVCGGAPSRLRIRIWPAPQRHSARPSRRGRADAADRRKNLAWPATSQGTVRRGAGGAAHSSCAAILRFRRGCGMPASTPKPPRSATRSRLASRKHFAAQSPIARSRGVVGLTAWRPHPRAFMERLPTSPRWVFCRTRPKQSRARRTGGRICSGMGG